MHYFGLYFKPMFCRYPTNTGHLQFQQELHNWKILFRFFHIFCTRLKNNSLTLIPNILALRRTYIVGLFQNNNNFILLYFWQDLWINNSTCISLNIIFIGKQILFTLILVTYISNYLCNIAICLDFNDTIITPFCKKIKREFIKRVKQSLESSG